MTSKEGVLFPLHLKENVMEEWPYERLVQPQDDGKPPETSGQRIPLSQQCKEEWFYCDDWGVDTAEGVVPMTFVQRGGAYVHTKR